MVLYFAIYSFIGWIMESAIESVIKRKFINRGFLTGPICPIYGVGAILIIVSSEWININFGSNFASFIINIVFATILVTMLEYFTGLALEKIFNCKWWDYSKIPFNFHGYICLPFSLIWGLLAFVLLQIAHPIISQNILSIFGWMKGYFVILILLYLLADTIKSVFEILDLRKVIFNYLNLPANKYYEKIIQYKRIFFAFPRLLILNAGILNRDVRSVLNGRINKIKGEIKSRFQ